MLLYLNDKTFVGPQGFKLAHEVREARDVNLNLVLVHEADVAYGRFGCPFERFFQTTPQDLIDGGLFRRVAVACHPGEHRLVSLYHVAKECGAQTAGQSVQKQIVERMTRLSSMTNPIKAMSVSVVRSSSSHGTEMAASASAGVDAEQSEVSPSVVPEDSAMPPRMSGRYMAGGGCSSGRDGTPDVKKSSALSRARKGRWKGKAPQGEGKEAAATSAAVASSSSSEPPPLNLEGINVQRHGDLEGNASPVPSPLHTPHSYEDLEADVEMSVNHELSTKRRASSEDI